jgi:hypothetical protein
MENTDAAIDPGAECQPILAGFQLGGEIFLLTFPFYRTSYGDSYGAGGGAERF